MFGILGLLASSLVQPVLGASEEDARIRAETIWRMDQDIGLSYDQLIRACVYIENGGKRQGILLESTPELPCVIEKIPAANGFLIKNLPGSQMSIGRGSHKSIKKAIWYAAEPKIVVDCTSDESGADEIKVLEKLRGARGIVPFFGSVYRGKKRFSIILEYFPSGSFGYRMSKFYRFSELQALKIAWDVACGLQGMHTAKLVHRDLHEDNILLKELPDGTFDAVIIDFGQTLDERRARKNPVAQASKSRNSPEVLTTRSSKLDHYLVDVYALGCDLYRMVWQEEIPWSKAFDIYALPTYSSSKKRRKFGSITSRFVALKEKRVGDLLRRSEAGDFLTPYEEFQLIIFRMIDPNPKERPTARKLVFRFRQLMEKMAAANPGPRSGLSGR